MSNENPRRGENTAGAEEGKVEQQKLTSTSNNFQLNSRLDWALAYASKGWRVFPLHSISAEGRCTCGQDCGKNAGKHPRVKFGFKVATTDKRQIEAWWRKWPDANIGIATGAVSGIVVVDIDGPEALARLQELAGKHEPVPKTLTVKTARGWHFYFKHPHADLVIPCTTGDGIDVRGDGGYVVAPPSVHKSGHVYRWCNDVTA